MIHVTRISDDVVTGTSDDVVVSRKFLLTCLGWLISTRWHLMASSMGPVIALWRYVSLLRSRTETLEAALDRWTAAGFKQLRGLISHEAVIRFFSEISAQ